MTLNKAVVRSIQKSFLALAAASLLVPASVLALGLRIPNQDAEAIARGNAFAATANNPSALYYNPAGISQLPGHNIELGVLNYFGIDSTFVDTTHNQTKTHTDYEMQPVPQLYYAFTPKESKLSYGLGVYAPYGLGLQWPNSVSFANVAEEGRLLFISINPVIAYKPHPTLTIAAGPMFNYSKLKLRNAAVPGGEFIFRGDDFDIGFNAGILWQPHDQWSFGLNYRSQSTMDYHGTTESTSPFLKGTTKSSAKVKYPQTVGFGISYRPTEKWNIEADIDWTDWSRLDSVPFKSTIVGDFVLPLNWRSSFFYEFGATYQLPKNYFVSAGYFFSENSTRNEFYNPTVPDTDLHTGSIGFGNRGEHWRWALAGQLITGPYNTVTGSKTGVDGKYQFFIPAATLSVGYHF
ncbi:MAG TPA: outer membrane protein transport protein [Verrucomicrobiae bacterium]